MTASETTPVSPAQPRRRLSLPFIDTGPLFDLQWLILLLPVWWAIGIEQFVWPAGFGFIAAKVIALQHGKIRVLTPVKWFTFYLIVILISGLFIVESERYLTFLRNFGAYISGFFILLIVTNRARTWPSVRKLLDAALIAIIFASLFGLLAITDLWRPSFLSAFGRLLPGWIVATSYGHEIAVRVLGEPGWFVGLGSYYRINSLFLYGTHYATVLVLALPFLFFRFAYQRGFRRILVGAAILLLLINLIFTTGRVAMVALLAGGIYFMLFHSLRRKTVRLLSTVAMSVLIMGLLFTSFIELSSPSQDSIVNNTAEAAQTFIFARGTGSYTSRFAVYSSSIDGFLDRPLFGWGTERDIPGSEYPAGSHSEFIAVLYRQGLLGILAFAGLLWSTWRYSRPVSELGRPTEAGAFLRYGRWFFVTALVNSIAADPVIDTTVYVFLWLFLALLVATTQIMRKELHDAATAR